MHAHTYTRTHAKWMEKEIADSQNRHSFPIGTFPTQNTTVQNKNKYHYNDWHYHNCQHHHESIIIMLTMLLYLSDYLCDYSCYHKVYDCTFPAMPNRTRTVIMYFDNLWKQSNLVEWTPENTTKLHFTDLNTSTLFLFPVSEMWEFTAFHCLERK